MRLSSNLRPARSRDLLAERGRARYHFEGGPRMEIQITDVRKRFGERTILDGVSLTVRQGETVAILGPSGGGKSTLLRSLNGLNTFDSGSIQVGPHVLRPGG